jgi:hypothetical protein
MLGRLADVLTVLAFCFSLSAYRKHGTALVRWVRPHTVACGQWIKSQIAASYLWVAESALAATRALLAPPTPVVLLVVVKKKHPTP